MDFFGLDILGAQTQGEAKKQRATSSGQRAVAAGQKLAKRAPKLSAAIVAAGQKALKAGGAKATAPAPASADDKKQPAPSAKTTETRRGPAQASRPMPGPRKTPAPAARPAPNRNKKTKVGEDSTDEQADIYTQLADAAASVAEFVGYFQGLLEQIPSSLPLHQQGIGTMSQFENWFGKPLEAALQGDAQALAKVPDINGLLEFFKGQAEATEKRWPWDWASRAETYLTLHPPAPAEQVAETVSESVATTSPESPSAPATTPATSSAPAPSPAAAAPYSPAPSHDGGGGYVEEVAYSNEGDYQEPDLAPEAYAEAEYYPEEEEVVEPDPFADAGSDDMEAGAFADASIDALGAVLGKGGGKGGGRGGGGRPRGGHHHRRCNDGGGPFYWGGPWPWGAPYWGIEQEEPFDEASVDDLADAVADKLLAKADVRQDVSMGLEAIGASSPFLVTAGDLRNAAAQLKVSADNLHLTAAQVPGWKAIYDNVLRLHGQYANLTFWDNFGNVTQGAWDAIADAQKRVDEFAAHMRSRGKDVVEPEHVPIDSTLDKLANKAPEALSGLQKSLPWIVAGGIAVVVLPAVVPLISAAVAARKLSK